MTHLRTILVVIAVAGIVIYWLISNSQGTLACHQVFLVDPVSGMDILGTEDIALDRAGGRLLVSAYDRRRDLPGGIYAVPLDVLLNPLTDQIEPERLVPAPGGPDLRPHGFAIDEIGRLPAKLGVIERQAGTARLQAYELGPASLGPVGPPVTDVALCNANDVAITPDGVFLVTADRKACSGWGRFIEDIFGLARGHVLSVGPGGIRVLVSGLHFADGIAMDARHVYIAATRDPALLVYDRSGKDNLVFVQRFALKDAPDNLAWGDDGALYIAAHRSLLRFALFRLGLAADSPAAIYRYDPASRAAPARLGWAGGSGAVSGATVALAARGRLVLGAGYDAGLSVCAKRGTELP
jgi:hypothetical protein